MTKGPKQGLGYTKGPVVASLGFFFSSLRVSTCQGAYASESCLKCLLVEIVLGKSSSLKQLNNRIHTVLGTSPRAALPTTSCLGVETSSAQVCYVGTREVRPYVLPTFPRARTLWESTLLRFDIPKLSKENCLPESVETIYLQISEVGIPLQSFTFFFKMVRHRDSCLMQRKIYQPLAIHPL